MATSSSDESCTAPKDFHLSSSLDSGSRLSPSQHKCQLCCNFRKKFYCKDCIQKGAFVSSSPHYSERFEDKKLRYKQLLASTKSVEDLCWQHLLKKQQVDDVNSKIRQSTERIRFLKLLLQEAKEKQSKNNSRLKFLLDEIKASNVRLPKYDERVEKLERYVEQKMEKVEDCKNTLAAEREKIKKIAKLRVKQLIKYIFPITEIQPSKSEVELSTELDTVSALAEATHTAYVCGRWILTDNSASTHYAIVAPSLCGSGDYCAYKLWLAENRDNAGLADSKPGFNITAALTYTCQLLDVLACVLDVRLPYRLPYGDFCPLGDLSEGVFARRVARLNANVLYLCFSQNVPLESLQSPRTLANILQLIEEGDLGRIGPFEGDVEMTTALEEQLAKDLENSENSDEEEGDSLPQEWEAVPHVQCPEMPAGSVTLPSSHMTFTQTTSMAGGLVTSLASIWRGWTGK